MSFFRRKRKEHPALKQVKRLLKAFDKRKSPPELEVRSRQEIISDLFESKVRAVGLEPASASDHIPLFRTPLARYLLEHGIPEDIVEAVMSGIHAEDSEEGVRRLILAASDTPSVKLLDAEVETAQEMAVKEWKQRRGLQSV